MREFTNNKSKILVILSILFFCNFCSVHQSFSQEKKRADSLISLLNSSMPDTSRAKLLDKISWVFLFSNKEQSKHFALKELDLAIKKKLVKNQASALRTLGTINSVSGNYNTALEYYFKSLKIEKEIKNRKGQAACYNNIGLVFKIKGDLKSSMDYYYQSLKVEEKLHNTLGYAATLTNIGDIALTQSNYALALSHFHKARKIFIKLQKHKELSVTYGKLGELYLKTKNLDSAQYWNEKFLEINTKRNDQTGIAYAYASLSLVLQGRTEFKTATEYAHKSLQIFEHIQMKRGIVVALETLGENYYHQKKYTNSISYLTRCITLAQEIEDMEMLRDASEFAAKSNEQIGNYKQAYLMLLLCKKTNEIILNESTTKKITQLEMQYEFSKKQEYDKLQQQKKDFQTKNEIQKAKIFRNYLIIGFISMIFISFLIYRNFRIKKHDNEILSKQKEEIEIQRDDIITKNQILEQQKEEITAQRDEIEEISKIISQKNADITDSIMYASKIQNALLPNEDILINNFNSYFIIYMPRDIVSGDFYWLEQNEGKIFVAVADCTGHGVPGAFMSMLGISLLNDIVNDMKLQNPSEILNLLRKKIKNSLHQTGNPLEQKDGMDISLCYFDIKNHQILFSGAYNSAIIIRNAELIELKADRMPVGCHLKEIEFSQQAFSIQKNDMIYLITDGYASQFGGEEGEKYKVGRLKKFLTKIAGRSTQEQKLLLLNEFETWKAYEEQVDDITIMGIQV